jgi:hypothetical protein
MTLEEALRDYLIDHAGITALVGTRVYPLLVAQSTAMPAISYQRISTDPTQHRGGTAHERVRIQIDGWAATYGGAIALREEIRAAMATFTRSADPRVDVALLQDARDLRDPDSQRWRVSMDYFIWATT